MKAYELSNGMMLDEENINNNGEFELEIQWANWSVTTVFTPDDDNPGCADNAVTLFERVYAKREYWLMLAYFKLKEMIISRMTIEDFDGSAQMYRDEEYWNLPLNFMKFSLFDQLLAQYELDRVVFGSNGEISFMFYDYAMDNGYIVSGTETDKLTKVEGSDDNWDDIEQ
ncbi:MAG: hypothetical protein IKW88_05225 [Clostridiales bacterium]|nr:hypothetical protein [Clostridiales bacterium]